MASPEMAAVENPEKMAAVEASAEERPSTELVNASGHRQELERNFSLLSICAVAVTTGNTWIAQGGSLVTAMYNGGPAGVIRDKHCCFRLLLDGRSIYCRARISDAFCQWWYVATRFCFFR